MAISFNTGTTATITNSATPSGTVAIPAGVLSGDVILVEVLCFATATGSLTVTLTSTATAPVAAGTQQNTGIQSGNQVSTQIFRIMAGGADAGATLTFGATGGSGGAYWFDVGLVSYTGAGSVDVIQGNQSFSASGTGPVTTPSATTGVSGDWQIQFIGVAPSGSPVYVTPGGLTRRETIGSGANAGIQLAIADSAASVGGAGASIGNATWTVTGGSTGNQWSTAFTVGLAPPVAVPASGGVVGLGDSVTANPSAFSATAL